MQAIRVHRFGGPEVLTLETLPTPEPGPGQVLVRIHAAGVNPVETYVRAGTYAGLPTLPYIPGSDAAGVIEKLGPGVTAFTPGQRVYLCKSLTGTYASHCLADAATHVRPLPDNLTFEQGAALFVPYYTAHKAAFDRGGAKPGDVVLIHGATGGVGLAALQWLKGTGATVYATGGSPQGLALLRAQGADEVFNHKEPDYLDRLKEKAPRGIDLILEMLANINLPKDLELLAYAGRVVIIGNRGEVTINPRLTMGKDADIRGMTLNTATPEQLTHIHHAVADGIKSGRINPVISHRLPLAEAPRSHELVYAGSTAGKIVLLP